MSPPSQTSHDFGDSLSKPSIYKGRVDSEILLTTRTARPQSKTLEALPFTSEEYNHAKSILTEKYGEESEIVKAYTREILDIPPVPNANSKKISEFSESTSLAFKIQFHLETEKIGVILRSKPGHQTFSALYSMDNRCTTSSRATKSCIDANPKSARPPTSGAAMMASSS